MVEAGAEVNARNKDGWTPLHRAARGAGPEMLTALLEAGAKVNVRAKDGDAPLHHAALEYKSRDSDGVGGGRSGGQCTE